MSRISRRLKNVASALPAGCESKLRMIRASSHSSLIRSSTSGGGAVVRIRPRKTEKSSVAGTTRRSFIVSQCIKKSSPFGRFSRPCLRSARQ